jgi:Ca2+-binding EF-hand superfamily protein
VAYRVSGDGKLQIEELLQNIEVLNAHSINGEQLMTAFNTFDVNKDGFIR